MFEEATTRKLSENDSIQRDDIHHSKVNAILYTLQLVATN